MSQGSGAKPQRSGESLKTLRQSLKVLRPFSLISITSPAAVDTFCKCSVRSRLALCADAAAVFAAIFAVDKCPIGYALVTGVSAGPRRNIVERDVRIVLHQPIRDRNIISESVWPGINPVRAVPLGQMAGLEHHITAGDPRIVYRPSARVLTLTGQHNRIVAEPVTHGCYVCRGVCLDRPRTIEIAARYVIDPPSELHPIAEDAAYHIYH